LLFCSAALLLCFACAPAVKKIEIPPYSRGVDTFFGEASAYRYLKGSFSLTLRQPGWQVISADAAVELGPDTLEMRFYRLGLPVGELDYHVEERYPYLKDALGSALLWWQAGEYGVSRGADGIVIRAAGREIFLDADSMSPKRQTVILPEGVAEVIYSDPGAEGSVPPLWYPREIRVLYNGNELLLRTIRVEIGR
jgi:hypothetical protein